MLISYKAYDRSGNRLSGTLEAESAQIAEDLLWQSDLIVEQVHRVRKRPTLYTLFPTIFGVKERQTIALVRQMATLLDSGLALILAIQTMGSERAHPAIRDALKGLIESLNEGGQLSDGMAKYPAIFPDVFVRVARIGEETGNLSEVLFRAADYLESQAAVKNRVRGSLTYPALVVFSAGISVYILLNFSIPMLTGLLDEFGADRPLMTKMILAVSDIANAIGLYVVIIVVGSLLFRRRPAGKMVTDRLLLKWPLLGSMIQRSSISRVTQTFGSLLSSGVPLLEAVALARDNNDNAVLKESLGDIRLELLQGNSLSDALSRAPIFPPMVYELVRVGESTGNLSEQLNVVSKVLQQDFDESLSKAIALIEPVLILGVGFVVALVAVTVITTVYSVLPAIQ